MKELQGFIRQYRHNNSDEFVMGYEIKGVDREFQSKQKKIDDLKAQVHSFLELQARHYGGGMGTHLAMIALCDQVRAGNRGGSDGE